mgnify:CR=1 FL=1
MIEGQTPESVELHVLSSLKTAEEIRNAANAGIGDMSWQVDKHARAWEYLLSRAKAGYQATSADVLGATGVALIENLTDTSTFLEELIQLTVSRRVSDVISEHSALFQAHPSKAVGLIIGDLAEIVRNTNSHTQYFDRDAEDYFLEVSGRAASVEAGRSIGIPTGLRALDEAGDMWSKGELAGIQGPLNSGKSFLLLWFCATAYYLHNKKILFLTPESTILDVQDRLSPFLGRMMGYEFSNKAIRQGRVNLEQFRQFTSEVLASGRKDWITRDAGDLGSFMVSDIIQQAREHRPDIIAIDGVHLLGGEGRSWENMQASSKLLKGLAQNQGLTIIGGTQVQRDAIVANDDTADLGHTAYGMAYVEACNKVISLGEKRGDVLQRIWKLVKNRDGQKILQRQYLRFDVDRGDIGDLNPNEDRVTGLVDF